MLRVSPFSHSSSYRFSGTCEHTLLRPCVPMSNFAVTADFESDDLATGRIGLRYDSSYFIYAEGSVVVYNAPLADDSGDTKSYDVGGSFVTVTTNGDVVIVAEAIGISIHASSSEFTVNATVTSADHCGLCGSVDGQLLHSDGLTVANITDLAQVMEFANSHVVPARDQFLREQSRQCGTLVTQHIVGGSYLSPRSMLSYCAVPR